MPLDDDDDDKWIYEAHTAAKHEVYRKYLTPWVNKLTSYNEGWRDENKIRVVDCFAGRGSYIDTDGCEGVQLGEIDTPPEYPGSPQIILDRLTKRSDQFDKAEALFIEKNDSNYEELVENIEGTTGVSENIDIIPKNGAFQEEILDIVETDGSDCPTFLFIDPFGFKALDYEVVTELGSTPQFEFLITFMKRDINRFLDVEFHQDAIETVFGTSTFREDIENSSADNWEEMVEYYSSRLKENGPEHTFEYLITEPDTQQTVYYLVFGSNHSNGLQLMREVMYGCGTGGFGYAPRHVEHDRGQSGLADFMSGENSAKMYLENEFEDRRIEFGNLVEKCAENRPYSDDVVSDYRSALRELEKEGEIEVVRLKSKDTGVQRGDLIDFRTD